MTEGEWFVAGDTPPHPESSVACGAGGEGPESWVPVRMEGSGHGSRNQAAAYTSRKVDPQLDYLSSTGRTAGPGAPRPKCERVNVGVDTYVHWTGTGGWDFPL